MPLLGLIALVLYFVVPSPKAIAQGTGCRICSIAVLGCFKECSSTIVAAYWNQTNNGPSLLTWNGSEGITVIGAALVLHV